MANFTLNWTPNINGNIISQQAEYRKKSVGGGYITIGFTPSNPMSISETSAIITGLDNNVVYEFRIGNNCSEGGLVYDGIIKEGLKFGCVAPTEIHTPSSIQASVSGLPVDITKVVFRLYDSAGTSLLSGPTTVNTASGSATNNFTGLTSSTTYRVRVELVAIVGGVEVTSTMNNCELVVNTDTQNSFFLNENNDSLLINNSDNLTIQ